jgi:exosortase
MSSEMANDVPPPSQESVEKIDYLGFLKRSWTPIDFAKLALLIAVAATLYYFFGVLRIYQGLPIDHWAWARYAPQYNFEHGKLVLPIFAVLVWIHRDEIVRAKKAGCNQGLIWVALGCLIFAVGARTLQGRVGMAAGPLLLYGIVLYVWGKEVARILLFPIAFLVFMIPVSAIEQATSNLQFLETGIAKAVCGMIGIPLYTVGTTLRPVDQSFGGFEIAEGCSGIRSLMAMVMITAIYVHLTQDKLWKMIVILLFSTVFAIIGNAGRIISIFIVAKLFGSNIAGGAYHEISGYVSFPIALGAMLLFSKLLDLPIFQAAKALKTGKAEPGSPLETLTKKDHASYDY